MKISDKSATRKTREKSKISRKIGDIYYTDSNIFLEHGGTIPRTQLDAKKEIHTNPLIEDIIENPPHDAIEYLKCPQDYFS